MPTSLHFSSGLFSGLEFIFILGRRIFTLVPLTDLFSRLDSDPGFNLQLVIYTAMLATAEKNTVNKGCGLEMDLIETILSAKESFTSCHFTFFLLLLVLFIYSFCDFTRRA